MMSTPTDSPLIGRAGTLWEGATHAAFLDAAQAGTLPEEAFARWLVQDYHFALRLLSFQAVAAAKTPRLHHKPLIAGLGAIDAELDWFEANARERNLALDAPLHPVCRHYTDFLLRAAYTEPYPVLLAILYGVEVSYLAAWSALEATGPYAEFIGRWSSPEFAAYVDALRRAQEANPHPRAQEAFNEALRHEAAFWRMTWEG